MKIYNTLSKKVEEFIPYEEKKVKMYTSNLSVVEVVVVNVVE